MGDDFTGVPSEQWEQLNHDARAAWLFAWLALAAAVLAVLILAGKSALARWGGLRAGHAHG